MPSDRVRSAFRVFHLTLATVVFVQTVHAGLGAAGVLAAVPPNWHIVALAGVEAVAAVLFLPGRTTRIGGLLLLGTFALAFVGHALRGEFAGALLVYGAGTGFVTLRVPQGDPEPLAERVMVHGSAWGSSVRHRTAV